MVQATHEANESGEVVKIPRKEFLLMIIIQLKQAEKQTGMSYLQFLESFEEENPDWNPDIQVDAYDDKILSGAIRKYMNKHYPEEDRPAIQLSPEDDE